MESIDCLLIHTPKHAHYGIPFGKCMSIMLMPMGLLSLADKLEQEGITTQILHMGIETTEVDNKLIMENYLKEHKVKTVGLSLHWHQQSFDVIDLACKIKTVDPAMPVFIGGITSSIFAHEILTEFAPIDVVVKGDAYLIVPDLVNSLMEEDKTLLAKVPNIVYRDRNGQITNTEPSYVVSSEQFDKIKFSNLRLIKNLNRYLKIPWVWVCNNTNEENEKDIMRLPLSIGLGCNNTCVYCGGCHKTQENIFNRSGCLYRDPQSVLSTITDSSEYGVHHFHICYNPRGKQDDAYYQKLFSMIKSNNLDLDISFESWGLPSQRFIDSFSQTFLNSSVITISPETAVESIRSRCKGMSFTNQELIQCLKYLEKKKIQTSLFFTSGLPYEKLEDIKATSIFQRQLLQLFPNINIISMPIELEPGAPIFVKPKEYGIIRHRNVFRDFYYAHKSNRISIGYDTNFMKENEILSYSKELLVNFALV